MCRIPGANHRPGNIVSGCSTLDWCITLNKTVMDGSCRNRTSQDHCPSSVVRPRSQLHGRTAHGLSIPVNAFPPPGELRVGRVVRVPKASSKLLWVGTKSCDVDEVRTQRCDGQNRSWQGAPGVCRVSFVSVQPTYRVYDKRQQQPRTNPDDTFGKCSPSPSQGIVARASCRLFGQLRYDTV